VLFVSFVVKLELLTFSAGVEIRMDLIYNGRALKGGKK